MDNTRAQWAAYLKQMQGTTSQAEFAARAGVNDGQLSKWLSLGSGVSAEKVIAVARTLKDSPVHALARVGFLTPTEATPFERPRVYALEDFTDLELAHEMVRRIENGEAPDMEEPVSDLPPTIPPAIADIRSRVKRNVPADFEDESEAAFDSDIDHDSDTDDKYE